MTKRIFKNTMIVALMVVLLCGVFILGVVYDYFNDKLLDSYILGLDDSFITVTSNNEELNYMFINANFNISLNPTASNGYLCYQNSSTDYAILQMFIN